MSLGKVSGATGISRRYLEQLATCLKGASLLRSVGGRRGGYYLARRAEEITIGQIIEAAIGAVNVVDCVGRPEICHKAKMCECRLVYMLINNRITEVLNEYSLADLADENWLIEISRALGPDAFSPLDLEQAVSQGRSDGRQAR